jgi:D-alanyl-D-alanine carboxypeptidase
MKKMMVMLLILIIAIGSYKWGGPRLSAAVGAPTIEAAAGVLMDATTGEILWSHNADEALAPASMSKMMTELIVLNKVKSGKLQWDKKVKASSYAAGVTWSFIRPMMRRWRWLNT